MKTVLLLITVSLGVFIGVYKLSDQTTSNLEITFDGQEGEYYFFTSETGKAIQFEENHTELLNNENFVNGNFIGKKFIVELDDNSSANSLTPKIKGMTAQ